MGTVSCQNWYRHWIILLVSTLNLCNALWSLQRKSFMGIFGEPDSVLNWTDSRWLTRISISCIFKIQHGDFQWSVRESDTPSSCWDSRGSGYLLPLQKVLISGAPTSTALATKSSHVSVLLMPGCPTACQEALGNISSSLAGASLASLTHTEPTTPTPPLPAGSTGLPEAELKMQGAFSFSSLGKAFYSVNAPWTKQQKAVSKAPDD